MEYEYFRSKRFPLAGGFSLFISVPGTTGEGYPTAALQKGLILFCGEEDLSEEGVGFGVPIVKYPLGAVFPGNAHLIWRSEGDGIVVTADYEMNTVERIAVGENRKLIGPFLNGIKELLASIHRQLPLSRSTLTALSNALRRLCGLKTTFVRTKPIGTVRVAYRIRDQAGTIQVHADTTGIRKKGHNEIIIMNEQGARFFNKYRDSSGLILKGNDIETWKEVSADQASFASGARRVSFTLERVKDSRLFRGRELTEQRLAWAGLAYLLPPQTRSFDYTIRIEPIP